MFMKLGFRKAGEFFKDFYAIRTPNGVANLYRIMFAFSLNFVATS